QLSFAGVVHRRPDLRFFAFHALSEKEGWWVFPTCTRIEQRLQEMVAADTRPTSMPNQPQDEVHFVVLRGSELAYLRGIFPVVSESQADCLFGKQVKDHRTVRVCLRTNQSCTEVDLITRGVANARHTAQSNNDRVAEL